MTYEIAKELKDAGFPQQPPTEVPCGADLDDYCYFPTLEELIEACGENFQMLMTNNLDHLPGWHALGKDFKNLGVGASGSTPTEAVARLWLALNKK